MTERPLTHALRLLSSGQDLSAGKTGAAVEEIIGGEAAEAEISAFLTALKVKGETRDELAGAVKAVRSRMTAVEIGPAMRPVLDTCGTGGDGAGTVNVSTATAIIVAACGVKVVKHGNRSASGNCGSAEVLKELGVEVEADSETLRRSLQECNIAFAFAPKYHPALKHAVPARKRLPFRTLFNLVGPLANPARPEFQLVGVPGEAQAELVSGALAELGIRRAAVVTGSDGLDEVTLSGPTHVRLVEGPTVSHLTWTPADFGLPTVQAEAIRIQGPSEGAERLRRLLRGEKGAARDVVLANAAAALWVSGEVGSLPEGVQKAAEAVDSGAAFDLLSRWAAIRRPS